MIEVPKIVRSHGFYWIPPLPPHWDCWIGEYKSLDEIRDVRAGLETTINSPEWQMMLLEMVDEFYEEWKRRTKKNVSK